MTIALSPFIPLCHYSLPLRYLLRFLRPNKYQMRLFRALRGDGQRAGGEGVSVGVDEGQAEVEHQVGEERAHVLCQKHLREESHTHDKTNEAPERRESHT